MRQRLYRRFIQMLLRWPHRSIVNCDRRLYLRRWYLIRQARCALFLHQFVRSDEDRALHDHPWDFLVIPLWRGYWEHSAREVNCGACFGVGSVFSPAHRVAVTCGTCGGSGRRLQSGRRRVWPLIGTRLRPATYRHRVELLRDDAGRELPSWSLFIRFRETRVWGFWMPGGFIAWNTWWQEKCE